MIDQTVDLGDRTLDPAAKRFMRRAQSLELAAIVVLGRLGRRLDPRERPFDPVDGGEGARVRHRS